MDLYPAFWMYSSVSFLSPANPCAFLQHHGDGFFCGFAVRDVAVYALKHSLVCWTAVDEHGMVSVK